MIAECYGVDICILLNVLWTGDEPNSEIIRKHPRQHPDDWTGKFRRAWWDNPLLPCLNTNLSSNFVSGSQGLN